MVTFILILMFVGEHGAAIHSTEFNSLEACEKAKGTFTAEVAEKEAPGYSQAIPATIDFIATCVSKDVVQQ